MLRLPQPKDPSTSSIRLNYLIPETTQCACGCYGNAVQAGSHVAFCLKEPTETEGKVSHVYLTSHLANPPSAYGSGSLYERECIQCFETLQRDKMIFVQLDRNTLSDGHFKASVYLKIPNPFQCACGCATGKVKYNSQPISFHKKDIPTEKISCVFLTSHLESRVPSGAFHTGLYGTKCPICPDQLEENNMVTYEPSSQTSKPFKKPDSSTPLMQPSQTPGRVTRKKCTKKQCIPLSCVGLALTVVIVVFATK